ncbi:PTS system, cellobiose-specific IIC component [Evansella caseinilytica]|uniref:Permease IIC component n=1 Tax=Evansella caseinilytica TaxID=1503961 RepID=A0A1H3UTE9_9BACI|nr:PTS transporter subunit EIIC [Evansella caseinilytica]SDZ65713.1 PTS system, cellobiose-specific IIC component [Evansella caseinilytica]
MSTKLENLQMKFQSVAGVINNNKYIKAISEGLLATLPVLIIGAFSTLLANLGIQKYQEFLETTNLKILIEAPSLLTISAISLYAVFFIAYRLAKQYEQEGAGAGLIALVSFLILTPIEQLESGANALPFLYLGAPGLFTAILVGLVSARIYVYIVQKGWTIKMPAGVPPTVSKSFANLIPAFIIVIFFLMIYSLFKLTSFGSLHAGIYSLIQAPLQELGSGFWSLVIVVLLINLLWFLGIHGGLVLSPVLMTVWMPLGLENLEAIAQGKEHTNIVTMALYSEFISLGGAGATIGLCLLMAFIAKSKRYKTLGKLALPASFFSINEPLMFGTPIVLNPYMIIPIILAPVTIAISTYSVMVLGILPIANGTPMPVGSPLFIGGFVQGGILLAVWQLLCIGISVAIYYPFFRILDKQALKEEVEEGKPNSNDK